MSPRGEALRQILWRSGQVEAPSRVFALLDAAADERIYPALFESEAEYRCLYQGDLAESLADVAPYLVALAPAAPFAEWLIDSGWGRGWASFVESALEVEFLLLHFQRFVIDFDENGAPLYFRFYDPRVLRGHLRAAPAERRDAFMTPLGGCVTEDETGNAALRFTRQRDRLDVETLRLPAPP